MLEVGLEVPEAFEDLVARVLSHLEQHLNIAKKAAELREFDTLEFSLSIIQQDATLLRSLINNRLQYLKKSEA